MMLTMFVVFPQWWRRIAYWCAVYTLLCAGVHAAVPVITGTPLESVDQDSEYRYRLQATDADGDRLTWRFKDPQNIPVWLSLTGAARVVTLAGSGDSGVDDHDDPLQATFGNLWGLAVDNAGHGYISALDSYRIRKMDAVDRTITTFAGSGVLGDGDNPQGLLAGFGTVRHMETDLQGNMIIVDASNNKIRQLDSVTGAVTTLAGSGVAGSTDHVNPALAEFNNPYGIAIDSNGHVYVGEADNIRKIDAAGGAVSTLADGSIFTAPKGMVVDRDDHLYVIDGHQIFKIDLADGTPGVWAGSGAAGADDNADPLAATFNAPLALASDSSGHLYVADTGNNKIRKIDGQTAAVSTFAGSGSAGGADHDSGLLADFNFPTAMTTDNNDNLLVAELLNRKIRQVIPVMELTGTPGNGEVGQHDICVLVSDGESEAEQCFTLTVNDINDAPVIFAEPVVTALEDEVYDFVPGAEDVDVADELFFSINNTPQWATFFAASGRLTGVPDNSHVGTTRDIVISVSDGESSAALPAFDLTVINVNDAPTISGIPATEVLEGNDYQFVPNGQDIDAGAQLTFAIDNQPGWARFDPDSGRLTGTPIRADVGTTQGIVISVTDGEASAALPAFDLTVLAVNMPPQAVTRRVEVAEDSEVTITLAGQDDDNDPLTFVIRDWPQHGELAIAADLVQYRPVANYYGADQFSYVANDGLVDSAPAIVFITVLPVDDPSIAINDLLHLPLADGDYQLTVLGNDNSGEPLQLVGAFSLDGEAWIAGNQLFFTPQSNQPGHFTLAYVVRTAAGEYGRAQVTVVLAP